MNPLYNHTPTAVGVPLFLILLAAVPAIVVWMFSYWLTMGRERRKWDVAFYAAIAVLGMSVWRMVVDIQAEDEGRYMDWMGAHQRGMHNYIGLGLAVFLFWGGVGGLVMAGWSSWGLTGWKQWLRGRTFFWAIVMAVGTLGLGTLPEAFGTAMQYFLGALAVFGFGALVFAAPSQAGPGREGTESADRERVLGLLERGAITGDEAAELLSALGERQPGGGGTVTGSRLMWIGAGLVVLGFFLPWATIDVGKMMGDMQAGLMQGMPNQGWSGFGPMQVRTTSSMTVNGQPVPMPPGYGNNSGVPMPPPGYPTGSSFSSDGPMVEVHAGDFKYGLGWVILGLAVAVVALPQFREFRRKPAETRRIVLGSMVGIGLLLSLYFGEQLVQYVQLGLVLNLTGYLLLSVMLGREFRQPGAIGDTRVGVVSR